jgi:hypothetical protein
MGRTCSRPVGIRNAYKILKGRDRLGDLDVDGRKILNGSLISRL